MTDGVANDESANDGSANDGRATDGLTDGGSSGAPAWMHVESACIRNQPAREYLDESGNDEGDVEHAWHATDQDGWMT